VVAVPRIELSFFSRFRARFGHPACNQRGLKTSAFVILEHVRLRGIVGVFVILLLLEIGCSRPSVRGPAIEFTRVPPATEGSPDKVDIIQGRVTGARPGQQIVLYAKTGTWWVQPIANEPFTGIHSDSTWINSIHAGTDYAALLVEPSYRPPANTGVLPRTGGGVIAVAIVKGGSSGPSVTQTLTFSGYEWRIRNAPSNRGGANDYDASNAWTDSQGALHLRIAKHSNDWTCAEVTLTRSLGYGTYSFVVRDISQLDPAAVFTMFTWDYAGTNPSHREMDIEVSRWGQNSADRNAQFVVQPFDVPENAFRFTMPGGVLTNSFRWEPGSISFKTLRGSQGGGKEPVVAEHVFTSSVPAPGSESVRMNLYIFRIAGQALQHENEVVIEKFEYLP
jgi:hypothetical protein